MNKTAEFDSKFVGLLLSMVFTDEILKSSTAELNARGDCYGSLDPVKLNFVKGIIYILNPQINKAIVFSFQKNLKSSIHFNYRMVC